MSNIRTSFCQVAGCRFSNTHLTKSHKCGKCNRFGHGRIECGNLSMCQNLKIKSSGIRFPDHLKCTSPLCPSSYSHSTNSHYCTLCTELHTESNCSRNSMNSKDLTDEQIAISEARKVLIQQPGKIYCMVYAGMACNWYVKRDSVYGPISAFFMHGDSWGQYGPRCDDRPKLNAFCSGYRNAIDGKIYSYN
jgi:hypothetical protein